METVQYSAHYQKSIWYSVRRSIGETDLRKKGEHAPDKRMKE